MAFKQAQLKAFETDLRIFTGKMLPEQAKAALVAAAVREEARVKSEQSGRAGITPGLIRIVDGARNGSVENVKPDGSILLDWNYLREAVVRTIKLLRQHGPQLKGDWKRWVQVEVNERLVDAGAPFPPEATTAYVFVNVPYARRLEIGRDRKGGPFAVQVPQHFVERVVLKMAAGEMRDLARFKFTFVPTQRATGGKRGADRKAANQAERQSRVPAIFIQEIQAA